MRKLAENIWDYKRETIIRDSQGIYVAGHLELFKTLDDAKQWIDKKHDGSNTKEPKIIGMWKDGKE